jgi:hypothetical protein
MSCNFIYAWGCTSIMKNKLIKTLSLGICFIMFSAFASSHTRETNTRAIMSITIRKIIIVPLQDPPFA